jgi:putative DNA primase/helicase
MLDATLPDIEVLRIFHPQIEIVAKIKVQMPPDVHIQQILGPPTSARKLIENSKLKDTERHLKEIRRYIIKRHFETGRHSTLVICQEKVEDWLTDKLPSGVTVMHFNDITGLDEHKHVRLLILLGRTQPGPDAPETLAGALSGAQPIKVAPNAKGFAWYQSVKRGIRLADGSGIAVDRCDRHPDPFVESLRWLICEGELLQAFGRARGINRTADTPLDIDILSNVVLPIIVNEVSQWKAPSLLFETAVEGAMLTSRVDMVKLWPLVWPNTRAADKTLAMGVPILPNFEQVSYQPIGANLKPRLAWFDRSIIPDPRGWLERHLGPLLKSL